MLKFGFSCFSQKKLKTWKLVEISIPSFIGNHEGFKWLLSGVIMKSTSSPSEILLKNQQYERG